MNVFVLEEKVRQLFTRIKTGNCSRFYLFQLVDLTKQILDQEDSVLRESYLYELLPVLFSELDEYEVEGISPEKTKDILSLLKELQQIKHDDNHSKSAKRYYEKIEKKVRSLEDILRNRAVQNDSNAYTFPVLETVGKNVTEYGTIEELSVTITTKSHLDKDEFFLVPSQQRLEQNIGEQLKNSWEVAKRIVGGYGAKFKQFHSVVIQMNKRYAEYTGNSLGITLTIAFIAELSKLYNLRKLINLNGNVTFTGSVGIDGSIGAISDEYTRKKVHVVTNSRYKTFVVPYQDVDSAKDELAKHGIKSISVVGAEKIDEILYRRDVIEIDSQNILVWVAKNFYRNKFLLVATNILIVLALLFAFIDFDNNPAMIDYSNNTLFIKNESNKVLFEIHDYHNRGHDDDLINHSSINYQLFDIQGDGTNELLLIKYHNLIRSLDCYDNEGKLLWRFNPHIVYETSTEKFDGEFLCNAWQPIVYNGKREIVVNLSHYAYYPNCIYRIDAETAKPVSDTLWVCGDVSYFLVNDFDEDGTMDILGSAVNNAYNFQVMFTISLENLSGKCPGNPKYDQLHEKLAEFDFYYGFPRTDLTAYYKGRFDRATIKNIQFIQDFVSFGYLAGESAVVPRAPENGFSIDINKDFSVRQIVLQDRFLYARDELIDEGKLSPPYTDTDEYMQILLNSIMKWDGKQFVPLNGGETK